MHRTPVLVGGLVAGVVVHLAATQVVLLTTTGDGGPAAALTNVVATVVLVGLGVVAGLRWRQVALVAASTMAVLLLIGLLVSDGSMPWGMVLSPQDLLRYADRAVLPTAVATAAAVAALAGRARGRSTAPERADETSSAAR